MEIVPTDHAVNQMRRRGITLSDILLVLELGTHLEGLEACTEVEGRPVTVVYDELEHRFRDVFVIVTVMRRKCRG